MAEKEAKARIKINKLLEKPALNVAAEPAHTYSKKQQNQKNNWKILVTKPTHPAFFWHQPPPRKGQ